MIREAADPKCSDDILNSVSTIDDILSDSPSFKPQLKNVFGLEDLEHDVDFVSILQVSYYLSFIICLALKKIISGRPHSGIGITRTGIPTLALLVLKISVKFWIYPLAE